MIDGTELLWFLLSGLFQEASRLFGLLASQKHDSQVELSLVEPRLQLEDLLISRDGFGIPIQQTLRQTDVKMRRVVFGFSLDRFRKTRDGSFVALFLEGFHPIRGVIRNKHRDEHRGCEPHTLSLDLTSPGTEPPGG